MSCCLLSGAVTVKLVEAPGGNRRVTGYMPDDSVPSSALFSAHNVKGTTWTSQQEMPNHRLWVRLKLAQSHCANHVCTSLPTSKFENMPSTGFESQKREVPLQGLADAMCRVEHLYLAQDASR